MSEYQRWDGDYEKQHYLVRLKTGEEVVCWPNAGRMHASDRSGRDFWPSDGIDVRPISLKEAFSRMGVDVELQGEDEA